LFAPSQKPGRTRPRENTLSSQYPAQPPPLIFLSFNVVYLDNLRPPVLPQFRKHFPYSPAPKTGILWIPTALLNIFSLSLVKIHFRPSNLPLLSLPVGYICFFFFWTPPHLKMTFWFLASFRILFLFFSDSVPCSFTPHISSCSRKEGLFPQARCPPTLHQY